MTHVLHFIEADLVELEYAKEILAIEASLVLARYAEFVRQYGD